MKRRQAVKTSATTLMGLGVLPGLSIWLQSCGVERITDYQPVYLSPEQFDTIWKLSDLILPATGTPGASDAGVAPYIDLLFKSYFKQEEKDQLEEGLNRFLEDCEKQKGKSFLTLKLPVQMDFVKKLDDNPQGDPFFKPFKGLVLWAYFTSEVGMKTLDYRPVPGDYQGCITLDENQKIMVGHR